MTPDDIKAWRKEMGFTQQAAANVLGISRDTLVNYEAGKRRDGGPAPIPRTVAWACAAIKAGVEMPEGW